MVEKKQVRFRVFAMSQSVQRAPYHAGTPFLVRVYHTDHPWVDRSRDQGGDDRRVYRNMGGRSPLGARRGEDSGHNNAPSPFLGSGSDQNMGHVEVGWGNDLRICRNMDHGMEVEDSDRSTYALAPRVERSDRRILVDVGIPSPRICAFRHVRSARAWEHWDFLEESMQ